jgi:hypothetical protein
MKLYTFEFGGQRRLGAEFRGQLVDLSAASQAMFASTSAKPDVLSSFPGDMLSFLQLGEPAMDATRSILAFIAKRPPMPVGQRVRLRAEHSRTRQPSPSRT